MLVLAASFDAHNHIRNYAGSFEKSTASTVGAVKSRKLDSELKVVLDWALQINSEILIEMGNRDRA